MPAVTLVSGGPVAANTTPQYTAQFVDVTGAPIPVSSFVTLTLSIVDKLTGVIINDCNKANILNTGRGTVSDTGVVVVTLEMADTGLPETPQPQQVQRALIFDYTYNSGGVSVGRHEADFFVVNLAGP